MIFSKEFQFSWSSNSFRTSDNWSEAITVSRCRHHKHLLILIWVNRIYRHRLQPIIKYVVIIKNRISSNLIQCAKLLRLILQQRALWLLRHLLVLLLILWVSHRLLLLLYRRCARRYPRCRHVLIRVLRIEAGGDLLGSDWCGLGCRRGVWRGFGDTGGRAFFEKLVGDVRGGSFVIVVRRCHLCSCCHISTAQVNQTWTFTLISAIC